MQYIILLPQLTHIELFCTKIIQRASTRLERYRYLVQKPWISWNIQISISFSFSPLLLQSHLTEESTLWHFFFTWFFAPLLCPLYISPSTSKIFFSISFPFLFLPWHGVGIHCTVSVQDDHLLRFLRRRKDRLCFWYKSLHHTWQ